MNKMNGMILTGLLVLSSTSFSAPAPGEGVSPEFQALYQKALMEGGTNETVRKQLDAAIGRGSQETIGQIYLMRANLFLKAGDEEAALSDFLKVTTLFRKNKAIQPEALFQASILLDKARDPRGADFRKMLMNDYPKSEFAAKAASLPKVSEPAAKPASTPAAAPAPAKKP